MTDETIPPRVLAAEARRNFREQLLKTSLGCSCGHFLSDHHADDWDRNGLPVGPISCSVNGCDHTCGGVD